MQSLLGGVVYNHIIDDWFISWESSRDYRHLCHQIKNHSWNNLLVVMFNPGSLSGDGSDLSKDTTLRILREVCGEAKLNPFVINLFDYATPSPEVLFDNWSKKDSENLVFGKLAMSNFNALIFAYGDYENGKHHCAAIKERQLVVRNALNSLTEIKLPRNKTGTPRHPMRWQREKIQPEIMARLSDRIL